MSPQKLKTAIFIILLMIMLAPMVQQTTRLFRLKALSGQTDLAGYPSFSIRTWFSDEFQVQFNKATEDHIGFRPVLIRLKNQLEYLAYNKANAAWVVVGKHRYMFESDYIRSYTGRDFLGDYFWDQKFGRLKQVTDTLARLGVRLAIVLEPGKASYVPEYIPSRFTRFASEGTNYQAIIRESSLKRIPLLDLNRFFMDNKNQAPYPLFPKGGIHWSTGGMVLAADTLLGFIHQALDIPVPDLVIDSVELTGALQDTDDDLANIMNLMRTPGHPEMGYPFFHLADQDSLPKPRALVIADSYYFNLLNANIPARAFANKDFWFYNKTVFTDSKAAARDTGSINIPKTVEGMDLVLIMVTERFYYRFDWDFTDVLYRHYFPVKAREYRYDFMRDIVRDFLWFDDLQQKSDYSGTRMQDALTANADYLFWQADQSGKIPHDEAYHRMNILRDPELMKQMREKALAGSISVDEQISIEARRMNQQVNQ
jgi:hypothetical protein